MQELGFTEQDEATVLSRLKAFQRRTVEYVFSRMYDERDPAHRFLVADEVGLGKTMVARGLIAKTILELDRRGIERIDVIYVCSNLAIAGQNINRLNVLGTEDVALSSRLTLLPRKLQTLEENRVNFVALTPGTSFDLKSRGGRGAERVLVGKMLFPILDELGLTRISLMNLLQATVTKRKAWRRRFDEDFSYNESLAQSFRDAVLEDHELRDRIERIEPHYRYAKKSYPESWHRYWVIGRLRRILARVCVTALEPDLVILDEFQRFRDLLHDDSDVAEIARDLMTFEDVRTLLLSATPYKMLTLHGDDAEEDHHRDFLRTLEFLFGEGAGEELEGVRLMLGDRRRSLYAGDYEQTSPGALRDKLHDVMVRTERVDFTRQRDAMLEDRETVARLTVEDLEQAAFVDRIADLVNARDPIEYWKSAPYLLNFMKGYQLKRKVAEAIEVGDAEVAAAIRDGDGALLHHDDIQSWNPVPPRNARLRKLQSETVDAGLWRLLWMPPAMPYEAPNGVWAELRDVTKTLVFSAWNVVPDAVSALLSYEAERRMTQSEHDVAYTEMSRNRGQLLNFAESDGRLAGMPALALLFPSPTLAAAFDPLEVATRDPEPADSETMRRAAMGAVVRAMDPTGKFPIAQSGNADEAWYWAALPVLESASDDQGEVVDEWARREWAEVPGERDEGFRKHVGLFRAAMQGRVELGGVPGNRQLERTLAAFAIASPAICALRALRRVAPELEWADPDLMSAAATVAWGFRTLFNLAETTVMIRAGADESTPYWRLVLDYCREGNLQAVLDEYVHVLVEQLGLQDVSPGTRVTDIAGAIAEALSIRTASLAFDEFEADGSEVTTSRRRLRTRFALRFGDIRSDDESVLSRRTSVRAAFNSPFRPFVLASTSVGQEGLDFHTYCHRVWHWNLPHNPVDLEQREGRVHRYKGHAIRRAVAASHGLGAVVEHPDFDDPWMAVFHTAQVSEEGHDLHPFWLYETDAGPRIERCVPLLPMSREGRQLHDLKRSLAVYRLAFGQARQDDLMAYLQEHGHSLSREELHRLRISLRPPS